MQRHHRSPRQPVQDDAELTLTQGRALPAFLPILACDRTRQGLYKIVKERLAQAGAARQDQGQFGLSEQLERASLHWLRHTFAKASLLKGPSTREVAGLLGHVSVDATMSYTEQDALDLVHALERTSPDTVAADH